MLQRSVVSVVSILALSVAATAQTTHPEVEPNETKALANLTPCLFSGDALTGTTTGTSTTVAGAASADTFRVSTCAAPFGIYRHDLVLSSSTPGHTGTLRGLTQTTSVINPASDAAFQTSVTTTTPARMNRWYGFGNAEEFYYRVTGTVSTTSPYTATLTTTAEPVIVVPGAFLAGPITIDSAGQGHTSDTDLWLYDGAHNAIFDAGNDEPGAPPITARPATLVRTLGPGVYTLAISNFNLANNLPAPADDAARSDSVIDFPDALANSSTGVSINVAFSISDGTTTTPIAAMKTDPYGIVFATFTVGTPPGFTAFCAGDGTLSDHTTLCPCGNDATTLGNGCGHSFDPGGANLSATGTAAADNVQLHAALMPSTSFTLFMQHDAPADAVFHDGTLCAGGTLIRLRGRQAGVPGQPGPGEATFPNTNFANDTMTLSQRGQVLVGSGLRRYYAAWYRNASTSFCPPATANVTNGFLIDW